MPKSLDGSKKRQVEKVEEFVEELKKNNIEINTWTVNKEEDIKDLINKGIDILIGNYPDLVKKIINENK